MIGRDAPIWLKLADLARRRVIVLPGDGRARIQPIHVDDLVACVIALLRRDLFAGGTYEVGGPEVVSFEEFVRRIHRIRSGREPAVIRLPLGPIRRAPVGARARIGSQAPRNGRSAVRVWDGLNG